MLSKILDPADILCRQGPRLVYAIRFFDSLFHPDHFVQIRAAYLHWVSLL